MKNTTLRYGNYYRLDALPENVQKFFYDIGRRVNTNIQKRRRYYLRIWKLYKKYRNIIPMEFDKKTHQRKEWEGWEKIEKHMKGLHTYKEIKYIIQNINANNRHKKLRCKSEELWKNSPTATAR